MPYVKNAQYRDLLFKLEKVIKENITLKKENKMLISENSMLVNPAGGGTPQEVYIKHSALPVYLPPHERRLFKFIQEDDEEDNFLFYESD